MRRFVIGLIAVFLIFFNQTVIAMTQYGPTRAGETLQEVAKKYRQVKGVSTAKMELVIKVINPHAFRGHELKPGSLLKIPNSKTEVEQAFKNPAAVQAMPVKPAAAIPVKPVAKAASVVAKTAAPGAVQQSASTTSTPELATSAKIDAPPVTKPPKPVPPPAPIIIKDQAAIDELKKNFDFEHAERMKVVEKADQLELVIKDGESQLRALEDETNSLKSAFPWSWVWFLALLGLASYLLYAKRQGGGESFLMGGARLAAARLGVTHADPPGSKVQSYPTKRFDENYQQYSIDRRLQTQEGHGAALADAMIDMAEGNGSAAEMKLKAQIDKEPENIELRMKLLEVYIEQNNREKFKELADDLLANLISEEDPEWARIQAIYLSKWVYD